MRNRTEIIEAIIEQVEWSFKIGKISYIDREVIEETAEEILSPEEYELADTTGAFSEALQSL